MSADGAALKEAGGRAAMKWRGALAAAGCALVFSPNSLWACAACYGQSDSPLAKGMNLGIFSLLAVVVFVLGSIAVFFVYLAKKSAATGAELPPPALRESTQEL